MRTIDRTVHASWSDMEVVRYDRSGKWYLEPRGFNLPRQRVSVRQAALYALWAEREKRGSISLGLLGGAVFDRIVVANEEAA